jgi:Nucleoside-diphosphate-sugar epimerases
MTNILITGSLGQVGSELIDYLVASYHGKILATDIKEDKLAEQNERIEHETLDVRDVSKLYELIDQYHIDEIYHLASILSATGEKDPFLAYNVNLGGTVNVLNAAVTKRVKKVFIPSSIAVYGPEANRGNAGTRHDSIPTTMYGITKMSSEMIAQYYHRKYNLDVRSIRYPGIISYKVEPTAGTTDYSVEMIRSAVKGIPYRCYLKEGTRLPMIYMKDAMEATLRLMTASEDQITVRTAYNIMSYSMTCKELEDEIRTTYPEFTVTYDPDSRQAIADTWPESINTEDAQKDWGFAPNFDLHNTVLDMIKNLKLIIH